jgi:hypothetical protein
MSKSGPSPALAAAAVKRKGEEEEGGPESDRKRRLPFRDENFERERAQRAGVANGWADAIQWERLDADIKRGAIGERMLRAIGGDISTMPYAPDRETGEDLTVYGYHAPHEHDPAEEDPRYPSVAPRGRRRTHITAPRRRGRWTARPLCRRRVTRLASAGTT